MIDKIFHRGGYPVARKLPIPMLRWLAEITGIADKIRREQLASFDMCLSEQAKWCYEHQRPEASMLLDIIQERVQKRGAYWSADSVRSEWWKRRVEKGLLSRMPAHGMDSVNP